MNPVSESDKLQRKLLAEQQKRMRPGECLKFITTSIDPDVLQSRYGSQIESSLIELGVKVNSSQAFPGVISWSRAVQQQSLITNDGRLDMDDNEIDEPYILVVMFGTQLGALIKSNQLLEHMHGVQAALPHKRMTLIVCGIVEYLQSARGLDQIRVERELTRLQMFEGISHRLADTPADLASTVAQFAKSVAEMPFKKQQTDKLEDQNFYMSNDNKDCVGVKGNAGLAKLWQHHLVKLPLATLETAEAIIGAYPMPRLLLNEYANTTNGADLLTHIPVRRAGGPLTSVRKIGPEMSRRVHALYTNDDPEHVL